MSKRFNPKAAAKFERGRVKKEAKLPVGDIDLNDDKPIKVKPIAPRTAGQKRYMSAIRNNDIVFVLGPAGTGKGAVAVGMACQYLEQDKIDKIILIRPAVEAGRPLGFLPGDESEKISVYLRPLMDELNHFLGIDNVKRLMRRGIIEVASINFLRGRTLKNAFIILDEMQNSTKEEMKMVLTRLGDDSKYVLTGDPEQSDLPNGDKGALEYYAERFGEGDIDGIETVYLDTADIVRHPLVKKMVELGLD